MDFQSYCVSDVGYITRTWTFVKWNAVKNVILLMLKTGIEQFKTFLDALRVFEPNQYVSSQVLLA